jgi:hypothetical protein
MNTRYGLTNKRRNEFRHQFSHARVSINMARESRNLGMRDLFAHYLAIAKVHRAAAFAL